MKPSHKPWKVLKTTKLLRAGDWFTVTAEDLELPNKRIVKNFYQICMADYAVAVPITPGGKVLMMRQYKHGLKKASLVLPGGHLDKGESSRAAAKRELLEETGYKAKQWSYLGRFVENGNYRCAAAFVYRAKGAWKVAEPQSGDLEESEFLLLSRAQINKAVKKGEIISVAVIASLALALNKNFV